MAKPIVHQEFDPQKDVLSYYTYDVLTGILHDLVEAYPHLAQLETVRQPGPADHLADGVRQVLAERARFSAAGLERAKAFSWRETARITADVYRQVLAA